jgi:hypothetical protein
MTHPVVSISMHVPAGSFVEPFRAKSAMMVPAAAVLVRPMRSTVWNPSAGAPYLAL